MSESDVGTVVIIKVGREVLHPSTKDHHIEWVKLFGEAQDGKFVQIGTLDFGQGTALPVGTLTIKKEDYTSLTALHTVTFTGYGKQKEKRLWLSRFSQLVKYDTTLLRIILGNNNLIGRLL